MSTPKPEAPTNRIVKLAEEDDTITITYTLKLSKEKIMKEANDESWTNRVWTALLSMRNLDDELIIRPGPNLEGAFKGFGNTNSKTVELCFMAEALTMALLSKSFKDSEK